MSKAARYAATGGVVLVVGAGSALADCRRPNGLAPTALDMIPLASGTAVSSMIATISAVNTSSLAQSTAFVASPPNPSADQQGGGQWSRVIGGTVETQNDTAVQGTVTFPGGFSFADANACRSTTKLDFIGTQAGMDIGKFNFAGGGNIQWGFTAGYFDVQAKDKTPNVGTFSSDNQVPFAGLYLALSSGNLAIDAQVRGDYYTMELSDVDQGMFNQPLTARGIAFLWNASYRFNLPNQWFIEPSIGGVSSNTEVDQLDVAGGRFVPGSLTPSLTRSGSVQVDDIHSLLGRASVRVGTTIMTPTVAWQPFVTGSVFREFAGNVRADISPSPFSGADVNATSFTSREGTFGHVGVGLAGVLLNTGWLGFVRGDYRFGDNIDGLSVNAGLRYQFSPSNTPAGGMKDGGGEAYKAAYDWSGLYAGWSTGALWGEQEWDYVGLNNGTTIKHQGYLIGGQVGYNLQLSKMVLGIEADYNFSNADGGGRTGFNPFFSSVGGIDSIGFLTGRVGYARERALYYVKGGLAFAEVEAGAKDNLDFPRVRQPIHRPSESQLGWAFGAGMEYALSDRWSVKGEWMHYELGTEDFLIASSPDLTARVDTSGDIARIGVNYHFGHRGAHHDHDALK